MISESVKIPVTARAAVKENGFDLTGFHKEKNPRCRFLTAKSGKYYLCSISV